MTLRFPVAPMKATLGRLPPPEQDEAWAYEIKWDGHRAVVHVDGGQVRIQSAAGNDVTGRWHEVTSIAGSVNATSAIIDGEMVVFDEHGVPSFDLVQRRHGRGAGAASSATASEGHLVFQAFDVLSIDGTDTTGLTYEDRRRLLGQLLEPGPHWAVPEHRVGGGADLVAATGELGLEGVIAKRLDSTYRVGTRTTEWRKIKHRRIVELPVGGYTAGTGARAATFGALLVGRTDDDRSGDASEHRPEHLGAPGALRFAGGVGTGFDEATLRHLITRLRELEQPDCPFDPPPPTSVGRTATWVRPELIARLEIAEFTNDGLVRHASFVSLVAPD